MRESTQKSPLCFWLFRKPTGSHSKTAVEPSPHLEPGAAHGLSTSSHPLSWSVHLPRRQSSPLCLTGNSEFVWVHLSLPSRSLHYWAVEYFCRALSSLLDVDSTYPQATHPSSHRFLALRHFLLSWVLHSQLCPASPPHNPMGTSVYGGVCFSN